MNRVLLLLVLALCVLVSVPCTARAGDLSQPGPHAVGTRTVAVPRTTPGGGTFSARLFYPAASPGADAPIDPAGAPYPAISFGHGFLQQVSQYQSTLTHLASHGYIAVAPESHTGFAPNHAQFAQDLRDSLAYLETQHAAPGSPLFGAVNTGAFGLSGHSMGGGCSILAASVEGPRVRAVAPLAPAETSVSAIAAMPMIDAPVALIVGTQDTIVPTATHGQPMYANGDAPKQLISITGGFHCGFTDAGFLFCDSGALTRAQQLALTRALLTSWFNLHLKSDESEWRAWWGPESAPTPALGRSAIAGFAVEGPNTCTSARGAPEVRFAGAPAVVPFGVRNTGAEPLTVELSHSGSRFNTSIEPLLVGPIAPGDAADVLVTITTANDDSGSDDILIAARSTADGATRAWDILGLSLLCAGDADRDGQVGLSDLAAIINSWGAGGCPAVGGDVTNDGSAGLADIAQVIVNWGRACAR